MKKYLYLLLLSSLFLSSCGKKSETTVVPTPTPRLVELALEDRPNVSLTSRSDGHELNLKLSSVSNNITKIEYELTYVAVDNGLEIEKGASGIIEKGDIVSGNIERKILLGTESCTSGCKYKYDTGITGGNLNLIFTTSNSQISTFDTPFIIRSTADIKKTGKIVWSEQDYTYTPTKLSGNNFYIVHKDFKNGAFTVTSSGSL